MPTPDKLIDITSHEGALRILRLIQLFISWKVEAGWGGRPLMDIEHVYGWVATLHGIEPDLVDPAPNLEPLPERVAVCGDTNVVRLFRLRSNAHTLQVLCDLLGALKMWYRNIGEDTHADQVGRLQEVLRLKVPIPASYWG